MCLAPQPFTTVNFIEPAKIHNKHVVDRFQLTIQQNHTPYTLQYTAHTIICHTGPYNTAQHTRSFIPLCAMLCSSHTGTVGTAPSIPTHHTLFSLSNTLLGYLKTPIVDTYMAILKKGAHCIETWPLVLLCGIGESRAVSNKVVGRACMKYSMQYICRMAISLVCCSTNKKKKFKKIAMWCCEEREFTSVRSQTSYAAKRTKFNKIYLPYLCSVDCMNVFDEFTISQNSRYMELFIICEYHIIYYASLCVMDGRSYIWVKCLLFPFIWWDTVVRMVAALANSYIFGVFTVSRAEWVCIRPIVEIWHSIYFEKHAVYWMRVPWLNWVRGFNHCGTVCMVWCER